MKFKAGIYQARFFKDRTFCHDLADRKLSQFYRGFDCIYAHKNENLQIPRVSATSCVFEYVFSNINPKTQKTAGKLKIIT